MVSMLKGWTLQFWISSLWWGFLHAQTIQGGDAQGLLYLKNAIQQLDGEVASSWDLLNNQNSLPQCSALRGVTCNPNGNVIAIELPGKMTGGTITGFNSLPYLQTINLQGNGLSGRLADWSTNQLVTLDLSSNKFKGEIRFFSIPSLKTLDLHNNSLEKLAESSLVTLSGLTSCDLSGNEISGNIPEDLPKNLTYFNIGNQGDKGFKGEVNAQYCPLITAGGFIYDGNPKLKFPDSLPCTPGPPAAGPTGALSPPLTAGTPPASPAPTGVPGALSPPSLLASPPPMLASPPPPCGACTTTQLAPPPGSCDCINPIFANMTIQMDFGQFTTSYRDTFLAGVAAVCNVSASEVRLLGAKSGSVLASLAILPTPPATSYDQPTSDRIIAALRGKILTMRDPLGMVQVTQVTAPVILAPPPTPPEATKTSGSKGGINIGIIVGAAVGAVALIVLIIVVFCCLCRRGDGSTKLVSEPSLSYADQILPVKKEKVIHKKKSKPIIDIPVIEKKTTKSALVTNRVFTFKELQTATNYFGRENLIGEGALGRVYKAELASGQVLAVKKLDNMSAEKERDFMTVVNAVGRLRQDNLVELEGYCAEPSQHALAYQFVSNGSLFDHLHAAESGQMLMWNHRVRIALGAARALEYLHEQVSPPVVHRNFKSANVLLDEEYTPKVADSGLAALGGGPGEKVSTQMLGTFGYAAPEYAMTGQHTAKSDVYSFGVVCLELLTGRRPLDSSRPRMEQSLVRWAVPQLQDVDALAKMADPKLLHHYPIKSLARFADIIALCVQPEPEFRPPMSEVVQALVRLQQRNTKVTKSGDQDSGAYLSGSYGATGDTYV